MMTGMQRSLIVAALIAIAGLFAFFWITAGFAAVTTDGVRRIELTQKPRNLPDIALVDRRGVQLSLMDYGAASPYVTFVTLVYVKCQSVCRTSASGQAWLQHEIRARGLEGRVRLLTISFDPANDTPAVLSSYARNLYAEPIGNLP